MAIYFLDSSGLVKRYIREAGSAWVRQLGRPGSGDVLIAARIASVEVVSAITRRQRLGDLSATEAARLRQIFRAEFPLLFRVIELSPVVVDRAMRLVETHALRAYDAVQLATALEVNNQCLTIGTACTFISADEELNGVAVAEGLAVEDPRAHP